MKKSLIQFVLASLLICGGLASCKKTVYDRTANDPPINTPNLALNAVSCTTVLSSLPDTFAIPVLPLPIQQPISQT
jgi:hypothetical protein